MAYCYNNSSTMQDNVTVYEFCQDKPEVLIWYFCLQFLNMLLGVPANIMVLWLIHKNKSDSSTSDIFIRHLAFLDFLFCFTPPLELACIVFLTRGSKVWYILYFFYGVKDLSPLFLSCICLDRYMAVVHPITFTKLKDRRHRAILATLVWIVSLSYSITKTAGNITNVQIYTWIIVAAFIFMVFCNISILCALRQSGPGSDVMHPVKKRAFKMVLIILAIIIFNYLPAAALLPFQHCFRTEVFRCYIHYIVFGLLDFSSSIQPLLYLSKEKPSWKNWFRSSASQTSATTMSAISRSATNLDN